MSLQSSYDCLDLLDQLLVLMGVICHHANMYESLLSIVGFLLNSGNIIKLSNMTHTDTILILKANF